MIGKIGQINCCNSDFNTGNKELRGLVNDTPISLPANTPTSYVLPEKAKIFAFELQGETTLTVGTSENGTDVLGEISGDAGTIMQIGLLNASEIWLQSDTEVEIIPIIYKF